MKTFVVLLCFGSALILAVAATPAISASENAIPNVDRNHLEEEFVRKLQTKCTQRDNRSCMMLKFIIYMNRIFKKSAIDVNKNLHISQNRDIEDIPYDQEDDMLLARSIDSEEETLGLLVAGKLWRFIRSRSLRYKFSDNADFVLSTEPKGNLNFGVSISPAEAIEEGRGRLRNVMPMMMMMAAKTGIIGALILKGLFLLAGKALIVSKIALLLAVILSLKKMMSQKRIVEIPHHDTYSAGWSRAFDGFFEGLAAMPEQFAAQEAQEMAFAGQKPQQ